MADNGGTESKISDAPIFRRMDLTMATANGEHVEIEGEDAWMWASWERS